MAVRVDSYKIISVVNKENLKHFMDDVLHNEGKYIVPYALIEAESVGAEGISFSVSNNVKYNESVQAQLCNIAYDILDVENHGWENYFEAQYLVFEVESHNLNIYLFKSYSKSTVPTGNGWRIPVSKFHSELLESTYNVSAYMSLLKGMTVTSITLSK